MNFNDLHENTEQSISKIFRFISSHSDITFEEKLIPQMLKSIESDIKSNTKKLRKRFNYQDELKKFKNNYTSHELQKLSELMDLDVIPTT